MKNKTIANPYLEELEPFMGDGGSLPRIMPEERWELVRKYSWGIPDEKTIRAIAKYSPIVEWGAGSGYWASMIAEAGGKISAFDAEKWRTRYYPIGVTDDLNDMPPARTLLLVWPPYESPMAYDATVKHLSLGGEYVAYCGEGAGGCTADDQFHQLLASAFDEVERLMNPTWGALYDETTIHRRKR